MKKIVATVLAMVMALALCTTAFAAETTTELKSKDYSAKEMGTNVDVPIVGDTFTVTKTDAKKVTVGDETTTTYYADKYVFNGSYEMYACDEGIADLKLIKGGKVVAYLTDTDLSAGVTDVATKYIEAKDADDRTCTDYTVDVYVIDGKAYEADGSNYALLNGAVVSYGTEVSVKGHKVDWTDVANKATASYNAKGEVVSVKCDCGTTFEVLTKIAASNTADVLDTVVVGETTYYVMDKAAAGTTTDTTATSPKTFDAGIAMYVGMALTSVAGSAVVIGKKKEF